MALTFINFAEKSPGIRRPVCTPFLLVLMYNLTVKTPLTAVLFLSVWLLIAWDPARPRFVQRLLQQVQANAKVTAEMATCNIQTRTHCLNNSYIVGGNVALLDGSVHQANARQTQELLGQINDNGELHFIYP